MNFLLSLFLILNSLFFLTPLHSQASFVLSSPPERVNLGKYCRYFSDHENAFKITEIQSPMLDPLFESFDRFWPSFPHRTSPIWIRCSIHNSSLESLDFYLEISYPLLDDIQYYEFSGRKLVHETKTGDRYPFLQRPVEYKNFLFPLRIPPSTTHDLFLRVSSKGALALPIWLWSEESLISHISSENILIGLFLGISIGLLLYNIFLFAYFHEMYYLYYSIFLFGLSFLMSTLTGISYQYLWQNSIWWSNYNSPILMYFTAASAILFTKSISNLKNDLLILDKVLYGFSFFNMLCIAIPFLVDYSISIRSAIIVLGLDLIALNIVSLIVFKNNTQTGIYILIGWIVFLISFLMYGLYLLNYSGEASFFRWSLHLGSTFLILIFALAIAQKINAIREEKERASEEVIRMQNIAIENIKTTQKQQEMIVAMNQELKIAREIHQSILPQFIPDIKNIKIHVSYIPMAEIGGDLYEFVVDDSGDSLGIFIADVTGKGIPAALLSSIVKATFTFHKSLYSNPAKLLRQINSTIISMNSNQMLTAGYLFLNLKKKIAEYANSGHPPLLVWRKDSNTVESFYPEGKIIGWIEDSGNQSVMIPFQNGDKFYLYTDGITEVRRKSNEIWGDENLRKFLLEHSDVPVEDMVQDLLQTLKHFSGKEEEGFEDDLTLICIEV